MSRFEGRRKRLRSRLKKMGGDALLVTNFANVTYLTGFTGDDSFLVVGPTGDLLISDGRYTTQLENECPGLELHIRRAGTSMAGAVAQVAKIANFKTLAVEADSMTVALYQQLDKALLKTALIASSGQVEILRQVKDKHEVARIRTAVLQAEKAFAILRASLRGGSTEKELADELEHNLRLLGARRSSFPPIVAAGPNSALPHAAPTDRMIADADFVLVDWGADEGLYKSDLTRVLVTGRISTKLERVYGVVLKAQTRAIRSIRPGVTAESVDSLARKVIDDAGFGRNFGHSLGHGIGLDIHESPRLAPKSSQVLKAGMVVTVEPGIYLPGWGGVRIEDDVLVTRGGCEVLTSVSKALEEMVVD